MSDAAAQPTIGVLTRDPRILTHVLDAIGIAGARASLLEGPDALNSLVHNVIGEDLLPDVLLSGVSVGRHLAVVGAGPDGGGDARTAMRRRDTTDDSAGTEDLPASAATSSMNTLGQANDDHGVGGTPLHLGLHSVVAAAARSDLWAGAARIGAEVVVPLEEVGTRLVLWLTEVTRALTPGCPMIAILGGCGGAGASTLALALAVRHAADGGLPTLVDLDHLGGGLDVVAGVEDELGTRWPNVVGAQEVRRGALPVRAGVAVLSHSRNGTHVPPLSALSNVTALRQESSLVVLDVGRTSAGEHSTMRRQAAWSVLLVTSTVAGIAGALRILSLDAVGVDGVVVRRVPGSSLSDHDVEQALGLPVLAVVDHDRNLAAAADRGDLPAAVGRSPYGRAATQLLGLVPRHEASA